VILYNQVTLYVKCNVKDCRRKKVVKVHVGCQCYVPTEVIFTTDSTFYLLSLFFFFSFFFFKKINFHILSLKTISVRLLLVDKIAFKGEGGSKPQGNFDN